MALSANLKGAGFMIGSMVAFTVNDSFTKSLADVWPLPQVVFMRSVFVVLALAVLLSLTKSWPKQKLGKNWQLILMRNMTEIGAAYFFITALFNMPLANATAILQVLPLTVSLAGALFLGEAIGWRRMIAIAIGFIGVMIIIRPTAEGFSVYSFYALAAVVCVTARDILSRKLTVDVPSMFVGFLNGCAILVVFGLWSAFVPWTSMERETLTPVIWAAVFVIGGYVFSVSAMRSGEIGVVAPFRYTSLLSALLLGWFVFGDWPDTLTLFGAGIVVATGLFTLYRESRAT